MATSPNTYYRLNSKQLYILQVTLKFRFITTPLLATHRGITTSTVNTALSKLHTQGYLGRHYDKSYKLLNRPAKYFLANKGIRYLRDNVATSSKALNVCYKDKHLNQKFISQALLVYGLFLELRQQYPGHIFLTANDLRENDHYPEPLPQLYFYKEGEDGSRQEYLADTFTETLFFYIKKRIDQYIEHHEDGEWPQEQYPTVLLYVPDSRLKEKAEKYFEEARDNMFIEDAELPFNIQLGS